MLDAFHLGADIIIFLRPRTAFFEDTRRLDTAEHRLTHVEERNPDELRLSKRALKG
jgi:hypothetical protein